MSEHEEQAALFVWAEIAKEDWPELALLHAIPNGAKLPYRVSKRGQRYSVEAYRLIDEGLKRGVPDVFLPVARDGYHGFYLEMKFGKGKLSEAQERFIAALRKEGYKVEVFWQWDAASRALVDYLEQRGE